MDLSRYTLATLHQDGEFVLCRARGTATPTPDPSSVLVTMPSADRPAADRVRMLQHELAFQAELDSTWAVRPLVLSHWEGRPALILEDQQGEPLARLLDKRATNHDPSGPRSDEPAMELGLFLRLGVGLAAALGEVHRRGIVHKNVKPANILVNAATGQAWFTGFGIASRLPRERQPPEAPETIAGTLAYMAPEQTGRMNRSIDCRSDLYALGVTLYEMLTGMLPFTAAEAIEWVHCHIAREPIAPDERVAHVPAPVAAIVMKLLAKTAENRYQTAASLERDLRRCHTQWHAERRVDDFLLGEQDIPDRLLIPEKLYGRARDVETLLAAFNRVVLSGAPELVLVTGYSGIGKSSVVHELHKALVPSRALFAAGKFDECKRDIPYSTLAQAFQGLIRPLLTKSDDELRRWREALLQALGSNAQLMVDLIPDLKVIIGDQLVVPELPPQDAQRRFQLLFRRFLGVFARPEHPLTLFLDDLQWLDLAALDLLQDLMVQGDVRHLLLIGAYRDNEVTATHPLMRRLETIRGTDAPVQEISLAPLGRDDICRLIEDSLYCDAGRAAPLGQLVHEKSAGNPFFAIQFLSTLIDEALVEFDHSGIRWHWDLPRIRAKGYTDNVIDLMVGKLCRLPTDTQRALRHMACLGNSADAAVLGTTYEDSNEELERDLRHAQQSGLVFRLGDTYRFLHDRVQEAAYSLVPEPQRAATHLRIGRLLTAHTPLEKREEAIFEIVNQLNRATALLSSRSEKEQLAEFNLMAGKRAKASTAYASALKYLVAGTALLSDDGWEHRPDLMFTLELFRAECEFLTGEVASAETRLTMLSSRAVTAVDRANVTCLQSDVYTTLDRSDRAVEVCLGFLRPLGIEWSPHPTQEEVRREYERTWTLLGQREIEELIDLPLMSDPEAQATMEVLTKAWAPATFTDTHLQALVLLRMVNLSLGFGNTEASSQAYAHVFAIAGPHFGNYEAGHRFGRLGYDLVEQRGFRRFRARTYLAYGVGVLAEVGPLRAASDLCRRAFEAANTAGDLTFAAFSCINLVGIFLLAGESLVDAQREAERGLEFAKRARFGLAIDIIASQLAIIRMLRGLTVTFGCFNSEQFDELQMERRLASDPRLAFPEWWYWTLKLQARFVAGDYASALDASRNVQRLVGIPDTLETPEAHFFGALSHAASCDSASPVEYRQHIEALAEHYQQLQISAGHRPATGQTRVELVGAEIARVEGRELDAERLYEAAIQSAREKGLVQNEALASELAARFYARRGFEKIAKAYLLDAREGYRQWGAEGKVRHLEAQYPYLTEDRRGSDPTSTALTPVEDLDLSAVLKVSQAVQSETNLEKLITAIMRLALEHAGAQRGLLISSYGDVYRIDAEATSSNERVAVDLRHTVIGVDDLPRSVLQYVLRTRERVLLQDASAESEFGRDEYLRRHHARSVLCIPLVKQARLAGILYLENNLTSDAFTPAGIALLEVLASDAAISLDNARLYHDLQKREHESRLIVETIPGFVASLSPAGELEFVNQGLIDYCGQGLEVMKQWGTNGTVHPDDLPHVLELFTKGIASGEPYDVDARIRRHDGIYRWFQIRGLPFRDMNGQIVRWYSLLVDIEDRKRAEDTQARQAGIRADVNAAFAKATHLEEILHGCAEAIVRHLDAAFARIWMMNKDDGMLVLQASAGMYTRLDGSYSRIPLGDLKVGWIAREKKAHLTNDVMNDPLVNDKGWARSTGMVAFAGYPLLVEDRRIGVVALFAQRPLSESILDTLASVAGTIAQGIERKRAEEAVREREREARLIVDSIPGPVALLSKNGDLQFVNRQIVDYTGRALEELKQWGTNDTVHPDDLPHVLEVFTRSIASGNPYEIVQRLRRSDGAYRWFLHNGFPVRDSSREILLWCVLLTDIDERKRAEAELGALKDQLYKENLVLRDEVDRVSMFEEIVGTSPELQPVLTRVAKVARTDTTVLITGETGTGKELLARAIHRRSARGSRTFVAVNCAAVPRELIASELFGHEKGAFTGATQRRLGRFELAHGGTLFLDEVGELPMETQVALLRVLQEREFERVGGSTSVRVDVRVIGATNRDLQPAIDAGTFRNDLFYRLNVFPIAVPALRERPDDIPLLVEYFIDRYARKAGKTIRRVNKRTLDRLRSYQWPGNVRELQNVIERSVIVCDTDEFTVDESWLTARPASEGRLGLSSTVAAHEKAVIEDALRACGGRVYGPSGAAERLGIPRSTLESRIRALRIDKHRFRP
jgi:PAS domain S-box-containing protein